MATLTQQTLDEMVGAIVREVAPLRIILFGSHAREETNPNSDLDFLIVQDPSFVSGTGRQKQMAQLWRRLAHYPVSQDFLIYTPDEIEHWRQTRNHVIARALQEGKVLYERS